MRKFIILSAITGILFAFLFVLSACVSSDNEVLDAGTDEEVQESPISPYLYGQNDWYTLPPTIWKKVASGGAKIIRIGGNEYNRNFPQKEMILAWVNWFKEEGMEAIIQVPYHFSADQAKELVTCINITQKKAVKYWTIGNEPDLNNEFSSSKVSEYIKRIAPAMKSVDPDILIFAPDTSWFNESMLRNLFGGSNDITGKDDSGNYYVDGVAWHSYPVGKNGPFTRANLASLGNYFEKNVNTALRIMRSADNKNGRTGKNRLRWGIGEFNVTYTNPQKNDVDGFGCASFMAGQMWADYYTVGMKKDADFMTPWSIMEGGSNGSSGDLGYFSGSKYAPKPRSTYYHLQMLSENFTGTYVINSSNIKDVKTTAAKNDTRVSLMILNETESTAYTCSIRLDNTASGKDSPLKVTVNAGIDKEYTVTIKPQATYVFVYDLSGELKSKTFYSIEEARGGKGPVVE